MTLRRRVVLTALLVAVLAAAVVSTTVTWVRARDMRRSLERVVASHQTEFMRDACQSDPNWFLAGPRTGRPTMAERQIPDPDVFLPRPSTDQLELEIFAYDDQYLASSTAGPRFPTEFRQAMRSSPPTLTTYGTYESATGTGIQMAQFTGWTPGPCAVLLFRMQPVPGLAMQRVGLYLAFTAVIFGAMMVAISPTLRRVRRTSAAMGEAAKSDYASVAPDHSKDEISKIAFVFNEAATEIRRRGAENSDRVEALRRHIDGTVDGVVGPLAKLEQRLAGLDDDGGALAQAHDASARLENLIAASQLRLDNNPLPRERADVRAAVTRVTSRHAAWARAAGINMNVALPDTSVDGPIHPLFERALGNIVDNAIRYNLPGGRVDVVLERAGEDGFVVRVTDTGRGVTDELFTGLTAIRRFRGDEATSRRPNVRGLGLAVALEIADRSGLSLELRKPPSGGFEASLKTKDAPA